MNKRTLTIILLLLSASLVAAQTTNSTAQEALAQGEKAIAELNAAGLSTLTLSEALTKAKQLYATRDYQSVLTIISQINLTREKALDLNKQSTALELRTYNLSRQGADTREAQTRLTDALRALQQENYASAATLIDQTRELLDTAESEHARTQTFQKIGGFDLLLFFKKNWPWALLITLIISLAGFLTYRKYEKYSLAERINARKKSRKTLQSLVKDAQTHYFIDHTLSKQEYTIKIALYQKQLLAIKRELPILEQRLKNIEKIQQK